MVLFERLMAIRSQSGSIGFKLEKVQFKVSMNFLRNLPIEYLLGLNGGEKINSIPILLENELSFQMGPY